MSSLKYVVVLYPRFASVFLEAFSQSPHKKAAFKNLATFTKNICVGVSKNISFQ